MSRGDYWTLYRHGAAQVSEILCYKDKQGSVVGPLADVAVALSAAVGAASLPLLAVQNNYNSFALVQGPGSWGKKW